MKTPRFPNASPYAYLLGTLLFLSLSLHSAMGQTLTANDGFHFTTLKVEGLDALTPLNTKEELNPYYEFLWIFSDGNFINKTRAEEVQYKYNLKGAASALTTTRAIATSIYTGGAPPPKIVVNNSDVTDKGETTPMAEAVKDGTLINLQRNHTRAVPAHTTTWILSVKNNLDTQSALDGYLLLYYDGLIERIVIQNGDTLLMPKTAADGGKIYGDFTYSKSSIFSKDDSGSGPYYVADGQIAESFKKLYLLRYEKLQPQEERHYFIDIVNDSALLDKAPTEEKGLVRFLAVGVVETPLNINPVLDGQERERLAKIGIPDFYGSSTVDTPFINGRVYDMHENIVAISKGHDPNKLIIDACECPADSELGQKLLVTIEFENAGSGDVDKVILKMDLPTGMDPLRIPDTLVLSHPNINPADITITRTGNTISWELRNLLIRPVMDYGVGHPYTYGGISFYAFLEKGVGIEALDGLQARIHFYAESEEPVYTPPAEINFLSPDSELYGQGDFNCSECQATGATACWWWPLPWWLALLLIVLLVGLAIYLIVRRNSSN